MKKIAVFLLLGLLSLPGYCQVVTIQNDKQNVLYRGIPNPLTVAVESMSSDSLVLTTDNGKMTKQEDGHFINIPARTGNSVISVYRHTGDEPKLISSLYFRVKQLPVIVSVEGKTSGEIPALSVYHGIGLVATVVGLDIDAKLRFASFSISIKRGDSNIFKHTYTGIETGLIHDDSAKRFFKTLQNGDNTI